MLAEKMNGYSAFSNQCDRFKGSQKNLLLWCALITGQGGAFEEAGMIKFCSYWCSIHYVASLLLQWQPGLKSCLTFCGVGVQIARQAWRRRNAPGHRGEHRALEQGAPDSCCWQKRKVGGDNRCRISQHLHKQACKRVSPA